jgi:hypothetical protein
MMQKYWYILCGCALLIAVGQLTVPHFFPICDGMMQTVGGGATPMRCYFTFRAEGLVGMVALLTASAMLFLRGIESRRVVGGFLILLAALGFAFPNSSVIGLCKGATMPCSITAHWLMIALAGQALVGLLALTFPQPKRENAPA